MRTVITGGGLVVTLILCILIHCTIISNNIRDNEVDIRLECAVDYGLDIMGQIYTKNTYNENEKEIYLEKLMASFCKAVSDRIGTDGIVKVNLKYADLEKGTFTVSVYESYQYVFQNRSGVSVCEKSVSFLN